MKPQERGLACVVKVYNLGTCFGREIIFDMFTVYKLCVHNMIFGVI